VRSAGSVPRVGCRAHPFPLRRRKPGSRDWPAQVGQDVDRALWLPAPAVRQQAFDLGPPVEGRPDGIDLGAGAPAWAACHRARTQGRPDHHDRIRQAGDDPVPARKFPGRARAGANVAHTRSLRARVAERTKSVSRADIDVVVPIRHDRCTSPESLLGGARVSVPRATADDHLHPARRSQVRARRAVRPDSSACAGRSDNRGPRDATALEAEKARPVRDAVGEQRAPDAHSRRIQDLLRSPHSR